MHLLFTGGRSWIGRSMEQELWKAEQYVDMALQYQRLDKDGRDPVLKEYPLSSLVKRL